MAVLTPTKIIELSEPVEDAYAKTVDALLINIGKHLTGGTAVWTAYWETQKLEELGQLSAENAEIIRRYLKNIPEEIRDALDVTRQFALLDLEKQLERAAREGYLTPAITDSSVATIEQLAEQAAERMNLVNTTMLQSSLDAYNKGIGMISGTIRDELTQTQAQELLNAGAMSVTTGSETWRNAVRKTIRALARQNLTGFIDRAGRHWSPEAYVNMDIRTTVHNTAIQAQRSRSADFGANVFQVSSHAGARPLCYPWQGKYLSWDNTSGTIELGDGSKVRYRPVSDSSYGQAAGLFGVNCGHFALTVIPGVSIPHGSDNIEPKAANDKEYQLKQQQRAYERAVREAKRTVAMAGSLADDKMRDAVKYAQAQIRAFCKENNLTRRYDRESIG